MIAILLARFGRPLFVSLGLAALVAFLIALAVWNFTAAVNDARQNAMRERDAFWRAEIATANAKAEQEKMAQYAIAAAEEARAREKINQLNSALAEMEAKNAALPHANDCGLDRERLRLLQ